MTGLAAAGSNDPDYLASRLTTVTGVDGLSAYAGIMSREPAKTADARIISCASDGLPSFDVVWFTWARLKTVEPPAVYKGATQSSTKRSVSD